MLWCRFYRCGTLRVFSHYSIRIDTLEYPSAGPEESLYLQFLNFALVIIIFRKSNFPIIEWTTFLIDSVSNHFIRKSICGTTTYIRQFLVGPIQNFSRCALLLITSSVLKLTCKQEDKSKSCLILLPNHFSAFKLNIIEVIKNTSLFCKTVFIHRYKYTWRETTSGVSLAQLQAASYISTKHCKKIIYISLHSKIAIR